MDVISLGKLPVQDGMGMTSTHAIPVAFRVRHGVRDVDEKGGWRFAGGFFRKHRNWVAVSNISYLQPYLGKIPILTDILQRG